MPPADAAPAMPPVRVGTAADELVLRARREIAEIVREVSRLAREPIGRDLFFASLVDRTVCAIAAEGAVIWDCQHPSPVAIVRTGCTTDASIQPAGAATHGCLLHEIAVSGTPAVVPSTPAATDPALPSNPTPFPAAVVPITDLAPEESTSPSGAARFVLEVFLENDAGVATQRGYLRFVTQMADLASEFLRADEIRSSRRRESLQSRIMASLDRLHHLKTSAAVAAAIVDDTAQWFEMSRVSLVTHGQGRPRLLAVSHVESIDHRGQASRLLVAELTAMRFPQGASSLTQFAVTAEPGTERKTDAQADARADAQLYPFAVTRDAADQLRLYLQDQSDRRADSLVESVLEHWSRQSLAILASRLQLESIPLAKTYLAILPKYSSVSPSRLRRVVTVIGAVAAVCLIALIPTPMVVTMPATLRPEGTRIHYAPSDAIVESVDVKHGQIVRQGDVLVRLRDWALEEQLTTLTARRGVLGQRLTRSIASLVEAPGSGTSFAADRPSVSDDDLIQQQRLLEEEIAGLDEQIELVEAARSRLTICAEQAGRIDAWQTELTAAGRPVRRGDSLMRVEPHPARWMADAKVAQSRLAMVLDRLQQDSDVPVKVSTVARPDLSFNATFVRREGMVGAATSGSSQPDHPADSGLGIELAIETDAQDLERDSQWPMWTSGAPATVSIDCAKRPLVQVIFFDLERELRHAWARWI